MAWARATGNAQRLTCVSPGHERLQGVFRVAIADSPIRRRLSHGDEQPERQRVESASATSAVGDTQPTARHRCRELVCTAAGCFCVLFPPCGYLHVELYWPPSLALLS